MVDPRQVGSHSVLTPSETVLLRPTEFIGGQVEHRVGGPTPLFLGQAALDPAPAGLKFQLHEGGPALPCDAWALAVVTTALLALERGAWFSFEVRATGKWAGLSTRDGLVVVPARQRPDGERWPEPSLEWQFSRVSGEREVRDVVKDWLESDSEHPGWSALARAREYLVARGLIAAEKVRHLLLFTISRYVLLSGMTDDIPAAAEAATLVAACERDREDLWRSLNDEVRRGIKSRHGGQDALESLLDD